jgi:CubicO group peptidase (beta-lactamase class C family)
MSRDHTRGLPGSVEGSERRVRFGLAWNKPTLMEELPGSPQVIAHGGATGTSLWIDPAANLVFVYFTNQWAPDRSPQHEALRGVYAALRRRDA